MRFVRALPVLPVHDLEAEVAFYETLSFHVQHREEGFVALERDAVLFGVRRAEVPVPPAGVSWQLEVDDVPAALAAVLDAGVVVHEEPLRRASGDWTLRLRTPAGYELVLEGPAGETDRPDVRALALALPEVVELVEDGRTEFRRVGGAWLARLTAEGVEVNTGGGVRADLRSATPDHVDELLRTAWEENAPPPPEVGPLRTE